MAEEKPKKKSSSRKKIKQFKEGCAYINATYNNTIVTLTDIDGNVIAWSSAGSSGFKGSRKATPFAAQTAAENAVEKSRNYGLEEVHVYIKGIGSGREQALRGLQSSGLNLLSITDLTPVPHNGCRAPRTRRV